MMRNSESKVTLYDGKYSNNPLLDAIRRIEPLDVHERNALEHAARAERERSKGEQNGEQVRTKKSPSTQKMIEHHLQFVVSIAKKLALVARQAGVEFDDLIQYGVLAIIEAAEEHDPSRGNFMTYIHDFLPKEMGAYIQRNTFIKTSRSFPDRLKAVQKAIQNYPGSNMREAKEKRAHFVAWLVGETGMQKSTVEQCLYWLKTGWQNPMSLDVYIKEDTEEKKAPYKEGDPEEMIAQLSSGREWISRSDTIPSREEEDWIESEITRMKILAVFHTLPNKQQKTVIDLRFGLTDKKHTLAEAGEFLGITASTVRDIERKAMMWLRHPARLDTLRELLD